MHKIVEAPQSAQTADEILAHFRDVGGSRWIMTLVAEIERLQAKVEQLGNCHRIVTRQAGFYKPELPDFTTVEIHLGVLRAAARCAGTAPWETVDEQEGRGA